MAHLLLIIRHNPNKPTDSCMSNTMQSFRFSKTEPRTQVFHGYNTIIRIHSQLPIGCGGSGETIEQILFGATSFAICTSDYVFSFVCFTNSISAKLPTLFTSKMRQLTQTLEHSDAL